MQVDDLILIHASNKYRVGVCGKAQPYALQPYQPAFGGGPTPHFRFIQLDTLFARSHCFCTAAPLIWQTYRQSPAIKQTNPP